MLFELLSGVRDPNISPKHMKDPKSLLDRFKTNFIWYKIVSPVLILLRGLCSKLKHSNHFLHALKRIFSKLLCNRLHYMYIATICNLLLACAVTPRPYLYSGSRRCSSR